MSISMEFTPEPDDEVAPLKKYEVNVTLDHFVGRLAERSLSIAQALSGPQATDLNPELAPHLQRISELANELQAEINLVTQIDPDALNRLKQA